MAAPVPENEKSLRQKILDLIDLEKSEGTSSNDILSTLAEIQGQDLSKSVDSEPLRTVAADEDEGNMTAARVKADSAYVAFGKCAPMPFSGEKAMDYRKRALMGAQRLAKKFHDVNIRAISDSATLSVLEEQIYQEAGKSVEWAIENTPGYMHKTVRMDEAGRRITEWHGDPNTWLAAFKTPGRRLVKINTGAH